MKSKISTTLSALSLALIAPLFAHAQTFAFFNSIISFIQTVVKSVFPLVTAVLIILFGYRLIMFLYQGKDSPEDHEKFKKQLIYSFVAVFMWFVLFGLVTTIASSLGLGVGNDVTKNDITTVELKY